jgi:gluconolactonase
MFVALPACAQAQGIPGVLAAGVQPELVQDGFTGIEGPVGAADGSVYFSDRNPDRTYHVGLDGKITVYKENTGATNGLAFTREGDMVRAEGNGRKISKVDRGGNVTTLTNGAPGKPLLSPNDLIVDVTGGVYFTDPGPRPVVPGRSAGIYYLPPGASDAILIDAENPRPNGIALTLDGKTLLVDNTLGPIVYAFDVAPDGSVKNKRTFTELKDIPAGQESGADGMAVDRDGRVYICTAVGVQVFDASGKYLGRFEAAQHSANIAFAGPDKRTLYMTGGKWLYRVRLLSQGPDRLGK